MAKRGNPRPAGSKPDKVITDALRIELHAEATDANGKMTKKLRLLARRLIDRGIEGDVPAIREVIDRIEGRVPQAVTGDDGAALVVKVLKFAELDAAIIPNADEVVDVVH